MPLDTISFQIEQEAADARWIENAADANKFLNSLDCETIRALDFETTSLFPQHGGVIRLSIITDDSGTTIIDHFKAMPFALVADEFAKRKWAVFNATFEGRWIDYFTEGGDYHYKVELLDVQFLRKAKLGGGPLSLAIMAKRDLKYEMDKSQQNSGWHQADLSSEQKIYAAIDGVVTWKLLCKWDDELTDDQYNGALVLNSAWRGTYEMEDCGLQLDIPYHQGLINLWTVKNKTAERYLRKHTGPDLIKNLNSNKQIGDFLKEHVLDAVSLASWPKTEKKGELDVSKDVLRMAAHRAPYPFSRWLAALMVYNKTRKYLSTYGEKFINKQRLAGKITSRFNMAQAITCRYSSSSENLQNIPNSPVVRRSFITARSPTGREIKLVMADYSSIEVRVLAELSGDEHLLHDAIYGDVHSRSASAIFKIDFDEFVRVLKEKDPNNPEQLNPRYDNIRPLYKSMRTRAKSFTFQLLYGAGYAALAIVLRCTDEEAAHAVEAWAQLYPKAYAYRQLMFEQMTQTGYLPVCDGRTIFVFKNERTMPVAANYPVQGAAASVMYRAVYHVNRDLIETDMNARLAASVHDELLIFSWEECALECKALLVGAMKKAWLDIFPGTSTDNLLEAGIGDSWAEKG